ncbi:MAG: PLP-dependent transferase, partial [Gammaproteobacteria bacterium]|nr:PLP-dependent transferase [Gammaproteobacteria bacterium]
REDCLASASGVNAVTQTLFGLTEARDHVIFFVEGYGPTRQIIRKMLTRFGITYSMLSIDDFEGLENELAARRAKLVFFESPTNPVNKIADIATITRLAQTYGALTVLDNTVAGFHQHGEFPVDFFVHSLTKFTTGAGDVMGGAVIADRARLDLLRADYRLFGAQLDALSASLMVRGMKTYFVRYRAQSAAALEIARFLEQHPGCTKVRYPGLESSPKHTLARQQMRDFGTVICFDLKAGYEGGRRFAEALKLFARTPSFGSTESLVMPPQMMQPEDFSAEQLTAAEIGEGTVRLSVGLENVEDLKVDLARALEIAAAGPGV